MNHILKLSLKNKTSTNLVKFNQGIEKLIIQHINALDRSAKNVLKTELGLSKRDSLIDLYSKLRTLIKVTTEGDIVTLYGLYLKDTISIPTDDIPKSLLDGNTEKITYKQFSKLIAHKKQTTFPKIGDIWLNTLLSNGVNCIIAHIILSNSNHIDEVFSEVSNFKDIAHILDDSTIYKVVSSKSFEITKKRNQRMIDKSKLTFQIKKEWYHIDTRSHRVNIEKIK